jgi:hypothetical protein
MFSQLASISDRCKLAHSRMSLSPFSIGCCPRASARRSGTEPPLLPLILSVKVRRAMLPVKRANDGAEKDRDDRHVLILPHYPMLLA